MKACPCAFFLSTCPGTHTVDDMHSLEQHFKYELKSIVLQQQDLDRRGDIIKRLYKQEDEIRKLTAENARAFQVNDNCRDTIIGLKNEVLRLEKASAAHTINEILKKMKPAAQ